MANSSNPAAGELVGDPITAREARCIARSLRVAHVLGATERLVHVRKDPVTVYSHPSAANVANAPDASPDARLRGGIDSNIPPHLWVQNSITDLRRSLEESFMSLEHAQGTARVLLYRDAQQKARVAQSDLLRAGGGAGPNDSLLFASVPMASSSSDACPPGLSHLTGIGEYAGLLGSPECRVARSSALAAFIDHVNGHPLRQRSTDDQTMGSRGGGGGPSGPTVTRRLTDAVAADCHMLVFEKHLVLAIPVPGWLSDEAFAASYESGVAFAAELVANGGARTGLAHYSPERTATSQGRRRVPPNAARLIDTPDDGRAVGATHHDFDTSEPWAPRAVLPNSGAEACRVALEALREVEAMPWTIRRQNPFLNVPRFAWEPRRFLVRVLPLPHVKTARALPRGWWVDSSRVDARSAASSSLQRAMLTLAAQLDPTNAKIATVRGRVLEEFGISLVRGGAGGAAFANTQTSGFDVNDTALFGETARVQNVVDHKAVEAASETAILWSGAHDATKLVTFVLKAHWNSLDPTVAAALAGDQARFTKRLRQVIAHFHSNRQLQRQQALSGFSQPVPTSPLPGIPEIPITEAATDDFGVGGEEGALIVTSLSADDHDAGGAPIADHELYALSDAMEAVALYADEHRILTTYYGLRTVLNPDIEVPRIQRIASGASRDMLGMEIVMGTVCGYHYQVEAFPVMTPVPPQEKLMKLSAQDIAEKYFGAGSRGKKPRVAVLKAFEHVLLVQTANVIAVCQRKLSKANYGSDAGYRANAAATVAEGASAAGSRMLLDHSSVLHISLTATSTGAGGSGVAPGVGVARARPTR
jgi:hypothetical protein